MAGPIAIDTPDYQRGVVSAQKLLATVPADTIQVAVGIPPNAETLIVSCQNAGAGNRLACLGLETVQYYGSVKSAQIAASANAVTWFFDISQVTDPVVELTWDAAPGFSWTVYADSAAHLVADVADLRSGYGQQYTIPSAPSTAAGDHPPVELQWESFDNVANGAVILAAPGVGLRYRIHYITLQLTATGNSANLSDSVSGKALLWSRAVGDNAPVMADYKPTGIPLSPNAGVTYNTFAANGTGLIVYTLEAV